MTNVPAHSLTLMNDPFVLALARDFAERVTAETDAPHKRVDRMFQYALGRPATAEENQRALEFVASASTRDPSPQDAIRVRQAIIDRDQQIAEITDKLRQRLFEVYTKNPDRRPEFLGESFAPRDITDEWIAERLPRDWQAVEQLRVERDQYQRVSGRADEWAQLAHAVFNMKEFIYVR